MIIVTGATGKLGRGIVEELLARSPADRIGVSVRAPDKAIDFAKRGVRVRHGDFADADSLAAAFEGSSQVLIVSSNARATGGDPLAQHRAAITAARAAGTRRIVYTSHMGASATSAFAPMHDHAATEAMLRDVGIAWTALRNGFYASTVPTMVGDAVATGVLTAPEDGKVSWTAHRDLAAAAAEVLLHEGRFEGPTPPLTASEATDLDDVAAFLSAIHSKPIGRQQITDAEQANKMSQARVPQQVIDMMLSFYRAARAGEFAVVNPALASLLGREPLSVREVLEKGSDIGC